MKYIRYILLMLVLISSTNMKGQYDPISPNEPGSYNTLSIKSTPDGAGYFNINRITTQTPGVNIRIQAYDYQNYSFIAWEENGTVISTEAQLDYTMPQHDVTLVAHYKYNPENPSEPLTPVIPVFHKLILSSHPSNGGHFNINSGNSYEIGTSVNLCAYPDRDFAFLNWTENGDVISTSSSFNYVVKANDSQLVANY